MEISGKTLKITVKAGFKSNTATLSSNNVKSIPSTSIKIDNLGYSTTFGVVELSIDLDQQTGFNEYGLNCAYFENGKCKVCGAWNSDKNDEDCD